MNITQDSVVAIQYTLRNDAGDIIDSSANGDPLVYMQGNGNLIPGLERELDGKQAGDKLSVRIAPEDGYGVMDDTLIQEVPRAAFGSNATISVGMQFQAQSNHGMQTVTVTKVAEDFITVDGNHPLAGQYLNFEVEITEVRAPSEEELSHGHVHGPGGHHH